MDKRTKEYKEWKKKQSSEGLGDTIEKITEATGVKKVVELFSKVTGIDCGCDERKEKLNKMFRYKRGVECLTEDEYNTLTLILPEVNHRITMQHQSKLIVISNRIFNERQKPSNCGSCIRTLVTNLQKVYNEYEA